MKFGGRESHTMAAIPSEGENAQRQVGTVAGEPCAHENAWCGTHNGGSDGA
jgi:hypothetical protein